MSYFIAYVKRSSYFYPKASFYLVGHTVEKEGKKT